MKIFGKVLELKLKERQAVLYNMIKNYMRIKFESNDNLPINNIVIMHHVTIIIRSVFAQIGKSYSQSFLDDALYEL